ncbi:MAG: 2-oxoacid:acceptor oxidoreductase family protein [Methanomassiliicoccales archaeon]|nr:MAG: 2-oxoacid:acceptor oxidoreductase family protein [Methanomassiliicoccales archaeon]
MSRVDVKLCGFGGQGIVLSGYILGKAASIFDKKEAVLTQSYGPEARGGACSADVVISEAKIDYPYLKDVNVLVVMSQEAYGTYTKKLGKNGILLIDEDLVDMETKSRKWKVYKIPATRFAEELGKKIVANIVMLGFFTAVTGVVSYEAMKNAILSSVPKGTEKLNESAFERGYQHGKALI